MTERSITTDPATFASDLAAAIQDRTDAVGPFSLPERAGFAAALAQSGGAHQLAGILEEATGWALAAYSAGVKHGAALEALRRSLVGEPGA